MLDKQIKKIRDILHRFDAIRTMLFLLIFSLMMTGALWAVDGSPEGNTSDEALAMEGDGYRLSDKRVYHIDGITQSYILDNYLNFNEKRIFATISELDKYIEDKDHELINQRIFDSGRIEYEIKKISDGPNLVLLDIFVKDTRNIIVLPYLNYNSNDGLLLSPRGRNYNFLGSMQALSTNLDYRYTAEGIHELSLNSSFSMPFRLWNLDWVCNVSEDVKYEQNEPLSFGLGSNLAVYLPYRGVRWKLAYSQDLNVNKDGIVDEDGYYLGSGLSLGGSIPTGIVIDGNELGYSPSISSSISYKLEEPISWDRRGLGSSFSQSLGFGRIDWIGNYRQGYNVSISNSNSYNYLKDDWGNSLAFLLQGHLARDWIGINSRLKGFYQLTDLKSDAGGPLRGIMDDRIDDVESGLYFNIDMPFNMWVWFMGRWFEGQLAPFVDAAYFNYKGLENDWNPLWYSAGLEGFAYLKASRSIYLRVSVGIDVQSILEGGSSAAGSTRYDESRYEVYIGFGHHY